MSTLEWFASGLGILAVWLTVRQNPLCWPIGLVMVLMYGWFFFDIQLYSSALLQGAFALLQVYGWWQWRQGIDTSGKRPVSSASTVEITSGLCSALLIGALLGFGMSQIEGAAYPFIDAQLTAFSLLAQVWMALKRWQCWLLWVALDVLYSLFYGWQGYWLTAGLYAAFTLLAVYGLREWRNHQPAPATA